MSKREEKNKPKGKEESKDKKDKKDDAKEQIKLRVFEEDDYFEEFEEGIILFIIIFFNYYR